ncbi:DNA methyltransferase [Thermatribacter velox]|jgi:DNA modification methylase|uniref:DNA methyltransferase n=1 Tax=Thermatribacter velox TaxID=3039681 RepID=A0ABZ2YDY7_9BACT
MTDQKVYFETEEELQKAILKEKIKGTPDFEIGKKYGVTFRYIERLITRCEGLNISTLKPSKKVKNLYPKDFREEYTTVWSFKQRGSWATHSGEYRGNWSPYIPRNVILKYSKPGELVLDYFCGAGTTAVECKLLGRKCIALDINEKAVELARRNVNFEIAFPELPLFSSENPLKIYEPELRTGDARDLSFLEDNSVDLICAHPPYANIIHYTDCKEGDLSFLDISTFLKEMSKVARESFRVLKPGRQCAILIGDTRRKKHVIPLGFQLINVYLGAGFKLRELVIKRQHNCKTTGFWYKNSIKYNFLLLAHEYLPIFEKPKNSLIEHDFSEEKTVDHNPITALVYDSPSTKLNELETTTVWLFSEEDFEKRLNENVIDRYSKNNDYIIIALSHRHQEKTNCTQQNRLKNKDLLFIKSPFLDVCSSLSNIDHYLQRLKETVNQELPNITKGGYIVIQAKDVRINGFVEPIGKKIVDILNQNSLWLKEIVVVTQEKPNHTFPIQKGHLEIVHQYLLVYEVKK